MGHVVYDVWAKKNTNCFVTIKGDFVNSRTVTTNIQKTLNSTTDSHPYFP